MSVVLYFQVHQPLRLKPYSFFDIGQDSRYFQDPDNQNLQILKKVAQKSYLPANKIILKLLQEHPDFHVSYSISGLLLEQCQQHIPEVIDSFKQLNQTGRVEFLAETYYHSLSFLKSKSEFKRQVQKHTQLIQELFDTTPQSFRNTELVYNNKVAQAAENLGFKTILAEGTNDILKHTTPNHVFKPHGAHKIKLLLKNYQLSDDIAFRFSDKSWKNWPVTPDKFSKWIKKSLHDSDIVNLFLDYETFGEHQWHSTGIFTFLQQLPTYLQKHNISFLTVSQAANQHTPKSTINIPHYTSWADTDRDLSAWIHNPLQQNALNAHYKLEPLITKTDSQELLTDWAKLSASDHLYYMSTKTGDDGQVHRYFSPYKDPFQAYNYYMNALHDLRVRAQTHLQTQIPKPVAH